MINSVHAGSVGAAHQSPLTQQLSKRDTPPAGDQASSEFARFLADVLTKIDHSMPAAAAPVSTTTRSSGAPVASSPSPAK